MFLMQSARLSPYSLVLDNYDSGRPQFWSPSTGIKGRDHLQRARHLLIHRHSSYTGSTHTKAGSILSEQVAAGGIDMGVPSSSQEESEIIAGPSLSSSSSSSSTDRIGSAFESDDETGSNSQRSLTPLPSTTNTYVLDQHRISSSDTLRLMSSPQSLKSESSLDDSPRLDERSSSGEDIYQEPANDDVDPLLEDGVAGLAAKSADETISTKRAIIASMSSPQQGWEILQGKRDEQVEEQVTVLGLHMHTSGESAAASDISRTPSQSTTGTEKSTVSSFGTAASSLQSAPSSDTGLHEKEQLLPPAEMVDSPKLYITTCSSTDELIQQRRDDTASLRRYHALLELVETESGYAEDLSSLVNVFFHNLTTQAFFEESELRLKAVCRNASDLLELHSSLAYKLSKIIDDCQISEESAGSDMEKAMRCEEAIIQVAQHLTSDAPRFDHYQLFCSRHAEALILIREAEKRHGGDDFAAFERICGNQIRGNVKGQRQSNAPSRRSSAGSSTPLGVSGVTFTPTTNEDSLYTPGSGTNTPSGSFASVSRRTSGRLLFADYLIKPIQRLCLYPLVLNSLHKYTPEDRVDTRKTLEAAISAMRKIADNVDKASKQREVDLMAELLLIKIEPHQGLPLPFLKSLGNSSLSGTLDVLYHHDILRPLSAPLRFHRMGLVVWKGFLLIVKVRKNQQMDCKYWLPLASAELTPLEDAASPGTETASWLVSTQLTKPLVPFAMRLSLFGHHFELSASNEKERMIWHRQFSQAISEAPSALEAIPCSLPSHLSTLHYSASASLFNFFAANAKAMSNSPESLIRMSSASTRASVDRNMIFSEELLAQSGFNIATGGGGFGPVTWSQKDGGEALITQQLRQNATPSIGSAVGAAIGMARMAATQVPTAVKRSRRMSMLNLTEIKPTCDVLLSQSPGEFSPSSSSNNSPFLPSLTKRGSIASFKMKESGSTSGDGGESSGTNKWKNTLLRRNSKALIFRNGSPTCSPRSSTTDLGQVVRAEVPLSPILGQGFAAITPVKPPYMRSKSSSLRDVWQISLGRRGRSQSTNSYVDTPTSATSSPALDNSEMPGGGNESNRSFFSSLDSAGSSSVAHLRRILSTSSQSSGASTRAKARESRLLSDTGLSDGASSPLREERGDRKPVGRSRTEMVFPEMSNFQGNYDPQARRKSEPNALNIKIARRRSSLTSNDNKSQHPLRRLTQQRSLVGPSSPASSVLDLANSSMSTLWTDHTRLKSVEEHTTEVVETPPSKDNDERKVVEFNDQTFPPILHCSAEIYQNNGPSHHPLPLP